MATRWNSSRAPVRLSAAALEAVMGFQVRKAQLDLLAIVARMLEGRRFGERSSLVSGRLMHVARDFA
jgi:hypothetical protein